MADSRKRTIVIASVLKPVDDTRLYEKIALSLACTGQYDVHIIGIHSTAAVHPKVVCHPLRPYARISIRRLLAPWSIFLMASRLKPDVLIIATHELLYAAMALKISRRCSVVYDVQENYYWNILYTTAFPLLLKPFVALYVRGKETLTAPYVDHFLLAEKGYEQELKFPGSRATILENKARVLPGQRKTAGGLRTKPTINLIFSGTLAETTGVFTAIDLAVKLHVIDDRIRLTIIGYGAQTKVPDRIRLLIRPRPFIELITSDRPVPHSEIVEQIARADFGMIVYQINPSTMNSIPTKLYEYLGFRLPVLLVNHQPWVDFCMPYSAAVVFDPAHFDAARIYRGMMTQRFYTAEPDVVYWESEEPKLLQVMERVVAAKA